MSSIDYPAKLSRMESATLLPALDASDATYIRSLATTYLFTFQELRRVAQAARDLQMWREGPLSVWWDSFELQARGTGRERKKAILQRLEAHLRELSRSEKIYPPSGFEAPPRRQVRLQERQTSKKVLGLCPAYSEETVCCGLHTLDAVRGCPFSCSYCTIQTFYGETAELEANLADKLAEIELDPQRRYHIGTGQSSDSLVWGNRGGVLDALLAFARENPNVLLELKSKSDNVTYLVDQAVPANVVCTWTMNTPTVIQNEEMGAASLESRIEAARRVADVGIPVGFHFHPMIYCDGWTIDYPQVVERLLECFTPCEVSFVSMGAVTLIKPVIQEIRRRGGETKILQMEMVQDHHGKLTYPDDVKLQLFKSLHTAFEPWHREVFFYLCMETASIWRQVLGFAYESNADFERDFLNTCLPYGTRPIAESCLPSRR